MAEQTNENDRSIEDILEERGATHGHYSDHAACTQELKATVAKHLRGNKKILRDTQQESIDMILHKIGRIVAGDANFADHWDDIAGYAKIANYRAEQKDKT